MSFIYASYILYLILFKNERSASLIIALVMSLISDLLLAIFFARDEDDLFSSADWTLSQQFYYVFTSEIPFLLVFLSHWIIYFEYIQLAMCMPSLTKIYEQAQDASNRLTSTR